LKSITIQRFRGIREGEVNDLTDINLIIGRNNSGKSRLGTCHPAVMPVGARPRFPCVR